MGYLNEAKKLGDKLVVAINDDNSVRRLKGVGRPINPVERRMAVLAGLEAVDWVVSFKEEHARSCSNRCGLKCWSKAGITGLIRWLVATSSDLMAVTSRC